MGSSFDCKSRAWLLGPDYVRGTTRAAVNGARVKPARATAGYVPLLCKRCEALPEAGGTIYTAQYRRLAGRRGDKRAIVAVAHSILVTIYNMLCKDTTYQDLGALYFDKRDREHVLRRALNRIEALGYKVSLQVA